MTPTSNNSLEDVPTELILFLFELLKDFNDRENLAQISSRFNAIFKSYEEFNNEQYDSKKDGIISYRNNFKYTSEHINNFQAVTLHSSDFVQLDDDLNYITPNHFLNLKKLTNLRIIHDSDYQTMNLNIFNVKSIRNIKRFSFFDQKGHQKFKSILPNPILYSSHEIKRLTSLEYEELYDTDQHGVRIRFMLDILKLIHEAINMDYLAISNSYLHSSLFFSLVEYNLTTLKLVNLTYLSDSALEYFMSRCDSLKTLFFYAESDKRNKRQMQNSTIQIIYRYIHRHRELAHIRLNAFGSKTQYENLLKLENLAHCTFITNKFEDTHKFRNILPLINTEHIQIYLQNLKWARSLNTKITEDQTPEYYYLTLIHQNIKIHEKELLPEIIT